MIEQSVDISVVAPSFNEQECLPELCRALNETLSSMGQSYEIIIADDGSTDDSLAILKGLKGEIPQLRVLSLTQRSGQTAAMEVGFEAARRRSRELGSTPPVARRAPRRRLSDSGSTDDWAVGCCWLARKRSS